jgi:hypothetical protein
MYSILCFLYSGKNSKGTSDSEKYTFSTWLYRGSFKIDTLYNYFIKELAESGPKSEYQKYVRERSSLAKKAANPSKYNYISLFASTIFPNDKEKTRNQKQNAVKSTSLKRPESSHAMTDQTNANKANLNLRVQGQIKHLDMEGSELEGRLMRFGMISYKAHPCTASCVSKFEELIDQVK